MIKKLTVALFLVLCIGVTTWASGTAETTSGPVYLRMYYPVGVAGPLAQLMDSMIAEFNKSQKDVHVDSIFSGGYKDTMQKAMTAFLAGSPPDLSVLDAPNLLDLIDTKAIVPMDEYVQKEGGQSYLSTFIQAFLKIGEADGKLWSIPWQRSTPILYYNKDFFSQAGLDPNKPPATWAELENDAKKLTVRDSSGKVTRWGVMIPNDYWIFKPLLLEAGGKADNDAGTHIVIDDKYNRQVYEWLLHLGKIGVTPGIARWSQSVTSFASGATAMLYNSTGALTYVRENTKYHFGTAFLPKDVRQVAIEGGGNFFIFRTNPQREAAAWEVIKWMTRPENTAKWSLGSGYIPVKKAAFDIPAYKQYTEKWPQALTAYKQLTQTDVERNMMTHHMNEIYDLLNALNENIRSGGNMDQLLKEAQAHADQLLSKWQQ